MIVTRKALTRRTILRGIGAAIGLPFLDAMTPALRREHGARRSAGAPGLVLCAQRHRHAPLDARRRKGRSGALPSILAPLEPRRRTTSLVLSNLTANWGRPLLVGAGDHGRALAAYMTGVQVYRTAGADLKLGVSADQIAANAIGQSDQTAVARNRPGRSPPWPATAITATPAPTAYNVAWKTETQPLPPISDPRNLFERLFGYGYRGTARRPCAPPGDAPEHSRPGDGRHAEAGIQPGRHRSPQAR